MFGISNAARRRTTEIDIEKSIEMTQEVLNLMYHRYEVRMFAIYMFTLNIFDYIN